MESNAGKKGFVNKAREQLAQAFIDSLSEGQLPWTAGWQRMMPQNAVSKTSYRGVNSLLLSYIANKQGWDDPRWCTYNQATKKGWSIIKGSKGSPVEYWTWYDRQDHKWVSWDAAREMLAKHPEYEDDRLVLRAKIYIVFNARQISGIPEMVQPQTDIGELRAKRDTLLANMGVNFREQGSNAYYTPASDTVTLPPEKTFFDTYSYMATLLHECGHATGYESRLNRPIANDFGSEAYAKEELRAEIGATFAMQAIGLQLTDEQMKSHFDTHKAYIQSWAQSIQDAPKELFAAIKDAEKISDYLIEKGEFEIVKIPEPEQTAPSRDDEPEQSDDELER